MNRFQEISGIEIIRNSSLVKFFRRTIPMSWPIPIFSKIDYPKPISLHLWALMLVAIASCAVGTVLLLWPLSKSTQTFDFWSTLIGVPLIACALAFGWRLDRWEEEQTDAEESQSEQDRLRGQWQEWTRRNLRVVDVAAFPAATDEIGRFADNPIELPINSDRSISFGWNRDRFAPVRYSKLLHLIATRFAGALRARREVTITLMLDDVSLKQAEIWARRAKRIFKRVLPSLSVRVEAQSALGGVQWITQKVDQVDTVTRLVIAAQLWSDEAGEIQFSEGAAVFLIEPGETKAASILRPMTAARDTVETGLAQIKEIQMSSERFNDVWLSGCTDDESIAIRSAITPDSRNMAIERLLDRFLGNPGPANGWIALAIAMEAMRGAAPQLVAWREPKSDSLCLCMISPADQEETTV
jgi:hypothetical protein